MTALFLRRTVLGFCVLFVIVTGSFFLIRLAPGGPFAQEKKLPKAILENVEKKFKMRDDEGRPIPLWRQYASYLGDIVLHGDLGPSYRTPNWTVNEILWRSFPISASLGLVALGFALFCGVVLGSLAAVRRGTFLDQCAMMVAVAGICLPNFVVGPSLALLFAFVLLWLPPAGWGTIEQILLPAFTLSLPFIAYISRLTRAGMLDNLGQDYVRTARAKGLAEHVVVFRHALRNSILPVVSFLGPAAASILTGSVVVERIFGIPGIGDHFVGAALNRDYTLVMGTVILYSSLLVLFNILVDMAYAMVDPRVRLE